MRRLIFLALVLTAAGCGGCDEKAAPAATTTAPAAVPAAAPALPPATEASVVDRAHAAGPATASPVFADSENKGGQPVPAPAPRELTRRLGPGIRLKKMPSRLMLNSRMLKQQQQQGTTDGQSVPPTAPAGQ